MPKATVIIPWIGIQSDLLRLQIQALLPQLQKSQTELIVSCNSKSALAQMPAIARDFEPFTIKIVDSTDFAHVSHARNEGAKAAAGEYLLFCDADDIVAPNWVEEMTRGLDCFDLVGAACRYAQLNGSSYKRQDVLASAGLRSVANFLPHAPGGNLAVSKQVLWKVGGFSIEPKFAEDIDFSWKAQLAGRAIGFVSPTYIDYRLQGEFAKCFATHRKYGIGYACLLAKYRSFGAHHSVLDSAKNLLKLPVALGYLIFSPSRRSNAGYMLGHFIGRLQGSFKYRVWAI